MVEIACSMLSSSFSICNCASSDVFVAVLQLDETQDSVSRESSHFIPKAGCYKGLTDTNIVCMCFLHRNHEFKLYLYKKNIFRAMNI